MELLLIVIGFFTVVGYFASRPPGIFHWAMVVWFLLCAAWVVGLAFGIVDVSSSSPSPWEQVVGWGLFGFVPFLYFVMRGIHLTINDVSRGVQKVNRHLDSPPIHHHGKQFFRDENTGQWYVYTAHVEQWTPTAPPY